MQIKIFHIVWGVFLSLLMAAPVYAQVNETDSWHPILDAPGEDSYYPLCVKLFENIQHYNFTEKNVNSLCLRNAVENFKEFHELPWGEPLDVETHRDLLFELMKMGSYGKWYYFNGEPGPLNRHIDVKLLTERAQRRVDELIGNGVELRLLRLPLSEVTSLSFAANPEAAGALNFLKITYLNHYTSCSEYPANKRHYVVIRLVNDELTGPDPRLNPKDAFVYPAFDRFDYVQALYSYKGQRIYSFHATADSMEMSPNNYDNLGGEFIGSCLIRLIHNQQAQ